MSKIVTIAGCPSPTSRATAVLTYAHKVLAGSMLSTEMINLRYLPADDLLLGRGYSAPIRQSKMLIREADGIIIAASICRSAYNGGLKAFFDLLPSDAFQGKILLPIVLGASPLEFSEVDHALRSVLMALGTKQILAGVYLLERQVKLYDRQVHFDPPAQQQLRTELRNLVREIARKPAVSPLGRISLPLAIGVGHGIA